MAKYKKLSHAIYHSDYHIVWVPKYRYRVLRGGIRDDLETDIRAVSEWLGAEVRELSVREDHVHVVVSIPPKVSVSTYVGTVKGKTAIKVFRSYPRMKEKVYWGNHFWAKGYFVSTVGVDEETIRLYVTYQEKEDKREEAQNKQFSLL